MLSPTTPKGVGLACSPQGRQDQTAGRDLSNLMTLSKPGARISSCMPIKMGTSKMRQQIKIYIVPFQIVKQVVQSFEH